MHVWAQLNKRTSSKVVLVFVSITCGPPVKDALWIWLDASYLMYRTGYTIGGSDSV